MLMYVTLNDKQLTKIRRDSFGFIFQAFNLIPTLTAEENITLPASIAGRKPDMEWVENVVKTVGIDDRLTHIHMNFQVDNSKESQQPELWLIIHKLYLQMSHLEILILNQAESYLPL